jgi:hypothetical protein
MLFHELEPAITRIETNHHQQGEEQVQKRVSQGDPASLGGIRHKPDEQGARARASKIRLSKGTEAAVED